MIPHQNVDELALSDEIIEAVRDGKFHIYAVRTIDEGIEILTDMPAGIYDPELDAYPEETIHYRVTRQLKTYTDNFTSLGKASEGNGKNEG